MRASIRKKMDKNNSYSGNEGLQLTTTKIRSQNLKKGQSSNKQLGNSFKLSINNAKRRREKEQTKKKTIDLALDIWKKCQQIFENVNYEELKANIEELDSKYQEISKLLNYMNEKMSKKNDDQDEKKDKQKDMLYRSLETMKNLSKAQTSLRNRLNRISDSVKLIEEGMKMTKRLNENFSKDDSKAMSFRKQLCIDYKAHFDPLFGGSIGYENGKRTDPFGDNLSRSVWDSKSTKTS